MTLLRLAIAVPAGVAERCLTPAVNSVPVGKSTDCVVASLVGENCQLAAGETSPSAPNPSWHSAAWQKFEHPPRTIEHLAPRPRISPATLRLIGTGGSASLQRARVRDDSVGWLPRAILGERRVPPGWPRIETPQKTRDSGKTCRPFDRRGRMPPCHRRTVR